jgi:hypothetical protein
MAGIERIEPETMHRMMEKLDILINSKDPRKVNLYEHTVRKRDAKFLSKQ